MPSMKRGDVLGHEFMGEVVEVGPGVSNLEVGDRVVVPFPIACGSCAQCDRTNYSLCENSNPNFWVFFFQAEDGIRGLTVTGVQTCALPISVLFMQSYHDLYWRPKDGSWPKTDAAKALAQIVPALKPGAMVVVVDHVANAGGEPRSEERRVGKEGRFWGSQYTFKKDVPS